MLFFMYCLLLYNTFMYADGFVAGTLIKISPATYVPIEQVTINDTLVASQNNQHCPIVRVIRKTIDHSVKIAIDDTYICAAYEQKFYVHQLFYNPLWRRICMNLCTTMKVVIATIIKILHRMILSV